MADFLMPSLGADMESGKVVQWLVAAGSRVKSGDVVVLVETHKGTFQCEVFQAGVIEDLAPVGSQLPVGGVLAHVRGAAPDVARPPAADVPSAPRVKASPAARRRAQELGIELGGAAADAAGAPITLRDLPMAVEPLAPPPASITPRGFDLDAMRHGIALAMTRAKREIPHYYLARTVDFTAGDRWLADYNATRPPEDRMLAAVLLLKASAVALARHPQFNGFWGPGGYRAGDGIHVGWAVAMRGGGLVAPAIHDADRKPLPELMRDMRDLVQRVRSGGLRGSEMSDPTVTVTSMGDRGADRAFGVIYPPQVALIGFGAVRTRPWVTADASVVACPLVEVSLSGDHRASDGHAGGLLLAAIDEALQQPERL